MAPEPIRRVMREIAAKQRHLPSFKADVYMVADQDCDFYYVIQYEKDGKVFTELLESLECSITYKDHK